MGACGPATIPCNNARKLYPMPASALGEVHLVEEGLEEGAGNDDDHVPIEAELLAVTPLAILLAEFFGEALQLAFGCLDSRLGVPPRLLGARLDIVGHYSLRLGQHLFGFGASFRANAPVPDRAARSSGVSASSQLSV